MTTLRLSIIVMLALCFTVLAPAQTTVVFQPGPEEGKDAFIHRRLPDAQHGDHFDFAAMAWTNYGVPNVIKSLIQFDLSEIPQGSTIISAGFTLWGHYSYLNGHHSKLSGSNEAELLMITEPWLEDSVTWSNQPNTTDELRVKVPESLEDIQHYMNMDVTYAVQKWVNDPESNHGFLFQLLSDEYYRCLIFASSDHEDADLHPKLEVTYAAPFEFDGFLTLRPDAEEGKDAFIHSRLDDNNFGEHADFSSMSGTNSGENYEVRNLITFNLENIPDRAIVRYAGLSLYSYNSPNNGPHRKLGGSNESELIGITSAWDEHVVTWDSQPASTDELEVYLPESQSTFEHYLNIDVTPFIRVMVNHENYILHGMMLKLVDEEIRYRNMIFASSDNADTTLHPKLVVCYAIETNDGQDILETKIALFPNPVNDILNIGYPQAQPLTTSVYNIYGQLLNSFVTSEENTSLDLSAYPTGTYFIRFQDESGNMETRKFVKE
jgi:hypothetical protein